MEYVEERGVIISACMWLNGTGLPGDWGKAINWIARLDLGGRVDIIEHELKLNDE